MDVAILLRYVCIFWMKNPLGINDDWWGFFASMWILGASLFIETIDTYLMQNESPPIIYYFLTADVNIPEGVTKSRTLQKYLLLFTLLIHVIIGARIKWHKKKIRRLDSTKQHKLKDLKVSKLRTRHRLKNVDLYEAFPYVAIVLYQIIMVIIRKKLDSLDANALNTAFNSHLLIFYVNIYTALIQGFAISLLFASKENIMLSISREIYDCLDIERKLS